jgi:hypothetical protein
MAEDFPHYRHEDSDDSSPSESRSERSDTPAPPPEQHTPVQQEGTIFSRDDVAPHLSRPLFEFIRKQEQPEARAETEPPKAESLPSVSLPSNPEMHTYQPPTDPEMAHAAQQAAEASHAEDDDDEDTADDHRQAAAVAPAQPAPQPQESQRTLNEQFEEIMRAEMGEDFAAITSGSQLAEAPAAEMPEATAAEDTAADVPIPDGVTESGAFYYNEDEPLDTAEDSQTTVAAPARPGPAASSTTPPVSSRRFARPAASAGPMPSTGGPGGGGTGTGGGPGGGGPGGPGGAGPSSPNMSGGFPPTNFNLAPAVASNPGNLIPNPNVVAPRSERRENHNGRWFVAGFVTGWVIKQHLANKKMERVQKEHRQEVGQLGDQMDSLRLRQQNMQRQIRTGEGQLQETQAAQRVQAAEQQRQQTRTGQQAPAPAAEAAPQQEFQARAEQATPGLTAAEVAAAVPFAAAAEMPLQQTGGNAEASVASGARSQSAETPVDRVFTSEAPTAQAAAEAAARQERTAQTPHQAAQEMVAQAYDLQAGEHIEHAAGGGHNIVVDKHGHEVHDAIVYGDEFQFQKRQEQARAGAYTDEDEDQEQAAAAEAQTAPDQQRRRPGQTNPRRGIVSGLNGPMAVIGSGLADVTHEIGAGPNAIRKRIMANVPSKAQNPVVATFASPWLWASVFVLLAAFFVAAFI